MVIRETASVGEDEREGERYQKFLESDGYWHYDRVVHQTYIQTLKTNKQNLFFMSLSHSLRRAPLSFFGIFLFLLQPHFFFLLRLICATLNMVRFKVCVFTQIETVGNFNSSACLLLYHSNFVYFWKRFLWTSHCRVQWWHQ